MYSCGCCEVQILFLLYVQGWSMFLPNFLCASCVKSWFNYFYFLEHCLENLSQRKKAQLSTLFSFLNDIWLPVIFLFIKKATFCKSELLINIFPRKTRSKQFTYNENSVCVCTSVQMRTFFSYLKFPHFYLLTMWTWSLTYKNN